MTARRGFKVRETTTTSGILSGANPAVLLGAVTGHHQVSEELGDGDTDTFIVSDNATPPNFEEFEGIYHSSSNAIEPTTRLRTSNGGGAVSWSAGGTRDVYIVLSGQQILSIFNPAAGTGVLVRTAKNAYTARQLALADNNLLITNPDGVAGNQTLDASQLLRKVGGSATQRTMDDAAIFDDTVTLNALLTLAATATQIDGLPHEIRGSGGAGDVALKFTRNGTQDYTAQLGISGALQTILTLADVASWLSDADGATSSSATIATIESDTTISVDVPAAGTYFLVAFGHATALTGTGASSPSDAACFVNLQQDIDGGGWNTVRTESDERSVTLHNGKRLNVNCIYFLAAPTNGSTYSYRVSPSVSSSGGTIALATATNNEHLAVVLLVRVA